MAPYGAPADTAFGAYLRRIWLMMTAVMTTLMSFFANRAETVNCSFLSGQVFRFNVALHN